MLMDSQCASRGVRQCSSVSCRRVRCSPVVVDARWCAAEPLDLTKSNQVLSESGFFPANMLSANFPVFLLATTHNCTQLFSSLLVLAMMREDKIIQRQPKRRSRSAVHRTEVRRSASEPNDAEPAAPHLARSREWPCTGHTLPREMRWRAKRARTVESLSGSLMLQAVSRCTTDLQILREWTDNALASHSVLTS